MTLGDIPNPWVRRPLLVGFLLALPFIAAAIVFLVACEEIWAGICEVPETVADVWRGPDFRTLKANAEGK